VPERFLVRVRGRGFILANKKVRTYGNLFFENGKIIVPTINEMFNNAEMRI
jgi:hypothetical protein